MWVKAFSTYIAIIVEAHPERVRDMLAYMWLIVREAQKFGGTAGSPTARCLGVTDQVQTLSGTNLIAHHLHCFMPSAAR